jgi:dephospho-CoA kinase
MYLLGITGSVGTGKTTVGKILSDFGLKVVDTDDIAREVVMPGQPALDEIREVFGAEYFNPDGTLNRGKMAKLVFHDPESRKRLEAILHPRIRSRWKQIADDWEKSGVPAGAVVIPLLFETNAQDEFDAVICVACSPDIQKQRLLNKGWSEEEISARIGSQLPLEEKIRLSDYVIWNDAGVNVLAEQVRLILQDIGISPQIQPAKALL